MVLFHGAGGTAQSVITPSRWLIRTASLSLAPDSRDQRTWDMMLGAYGPDADFLANALGQTPALFDRPRATGACRPL